MNLLAFSCKGRWFCPSCHQKKVQLFGALLTETILFPVPHRHFTLGIPKMLRPYFRFKRDLLKDFCRRPTNACWSSCAPRSACLTATPAS